MKLCVGHAQAFQGDCPICGHPEVKRLELQVERLEGTERKLSGSLQKMNTEFSELMGERNNLRLQKSELEAKLAHCEANLSVERHQAKGMDLELQESNRLNGELLAACEEILGLQKSWEADHHNMALMDKLVEGWARFLRVVTEAKEKQTEKRKDECGVPPGRCYCGGCVM